MQQPADFDNIRSGDETNTRFHRRDQQHRLLLMLMLPPRRLDCCYYYYSTRRRRFISIRLLYAPPTRNRFRREQSVESKVRARHVFIARSFSPFGLCAKREERIGFFNGVFFFFIRLRTRKFYHVTVVSGMELRLI